MVMLKRLFVMFMRRVYCLCSSRPCSTSQILLERFVYFYAWKPRGKATVL